MNAKKKGKDPQEAIKHAATKTLKEGAYNGVRSYGIAFGGSLLRDMMQNSATKSSRALVRAHCL
ncbi:hypothetical protein JP0070_08800 [Helicobacter pylori]|nr:hypothetical protein JP0070_08800 [Helicobacter pylori]